jgi:hypothetical protein
MIKLVIKGNIIFIFHKYFYEDISKSFPSGNHFGRDIVHTTPWPSLVRDKEKSFIHTSSYWSYEA